MSTPRKSILPTVLVVCACAGIASYFAFFKGKSNPTEPGLAVAAASVDPGPAPAPEKKEEPKAETPPPPKEEPAPAPKADATPAARNPIHEIEELCSQGRWREARAKIAPLFAAPATDADRNALARKGVEASQQLLQQNPDDKDVELYEIQQGDTLEGIAKKFKNLNGVKGGILLVNNYKENAILRAGRKIRIPRGTWSAVVDKSIFKIWICYEGAPFKAYSCTIGAPAKETPVTKFSVGGRTPKPSWWPPADMKVSGKVPVPYGDPQNPLGDWWISLDHDLHHGIGIHGTNDPASIGTKASNGCVRMLNEEVGDVAALAFKGMVVTVVD